MAIDEKAPMSEKEYQKMIYEKAKKVKTKEELVLFLDEIMEFKHDYGTIVYGCVAAMKAAMKVINASPKCGGVTGYQAGFMGWEMIRDLMMVEGPLKLVDFNNMLFPQYEDKFQQTITSEIWEELQKKAKANLLEREGAEKCRKHWQSIVDGEVPFGWSVKGD